MDSLPVAHHARDSLPGVNGIVVKVLYQAVLAERSLEQEAGDCFHDSSAVVVADIQRMVGSEQG